MKIALWEYRKSRVCGWCWLNPDRRRFRLVPVPHRSGRCDFCGRRCEVWVSHEPTRRRWWELLQRWWQYRRGYRWLLFWDVDPFAITVDSLLDADARHGRPVYRNMKN